MSNISTLWEALTPPDQTNVSYAENDHKRSFKGAAGHRVFEWGLPPRLGVTAHAGSIRQVEYELTAMLRLSSSGKTTSTLADRVANETNLLMGAVENASSWPAGVLSVMSETAEAEIDDNGDAEVIFTFITLVEETD